MSVVKEIVMKRILFLVILVSLFIIGCQPIDNSPNISIEVNETTKEQPTDEVTCPSSLYKEYKFFFVNISPATNNARLMFNLSTDNGSNYNVVRTTTFFTAYHNEDDSGTALFYGGNNDLAQALGGSQTFGELAWNQGADADQSVRGYLQLFNPS